MEVITERLTDQAIWSIWKIGQKLLAQFAWFVLDFREIYRPKSLLQVFDRKGYLPLQSCVAWFVLRQPPRDPVN